MTADNGSVTNNKQTANRSKNDKIRDYFVRHVWMRVRCLQAPIRKQSQNNFQITKRSEEVSVSKVQHVCCIYVDSGRQKTANQI